MNYNADNSESSHLSRTILANLESDWFEMFEQFSDDERRIRNCFEFLVNKYSEKERFYHDLRHVHSLLTLAEDFGQKLTDYDCVKLAIWFHDVIYDAKRSDNELKSAELAVANLSEMNFPEKKIGKVEKMILATQKHCAEGLDFDGELFLDFDLSILGAEKDIYKKYSAAIRREYSFVPDALYRYKRKLILQQFLQRPNLYFTEAMRLRFETKARNNIKNEIKKLSK